ncbi:hypothetical protein NE237_021558 [Protea cynaroides]|uniref:shikimate kinase n=1 Tax=Protea cynaroides TaxID=273540 RepID=A0A9Q0H8S0_9MAGN|nr:hypothetical protein NE237_021558 [Protea cynaroides]
MINTATSSPSTLYPSSVPANSFAPNYNHSVWEDLISSDLWFYVCYNSQEEKGIHNFNFRDLEWRSASARPKIVALEISASYKNTLASALETIVGKILSEVLGYSFYDSDKLILKQYSESFFRDNESEALRKLSLMRQLVVATGGGVVIHPINWKYMKQGITVWLDVPLEALARRIAAVGTDSRPLLHGESGDVYSKALFQLSTLFEERGEAYANANARVSLPHITAKLGFDDISDLTPIAIATEALVQIEYFVKSDDDMTIARNS